MLSTIQQVHTQMYNIAVKMAERDDRIDKEELDIGDKEASGRVLLGMFMNIIRKVPSDKYPSISLRVDHEYRVLDCKKFAVDEAIVAITRVVSVGRVVREVIFGLEYKPKVSSSQPLLT